MIKIPGRRISFGESFYTEWMPRGGDCALLRAQALYINDQGGAPTVRISCETRSEEDTSTTLMDTYYPSAAPKLLELSSVGVGTAIYLATTSTNSPVRGFKEQVRFKVTLNGGELGEYFVIRILPLVFFDNSIP